MYWSSGRRSFIKMLAHPFEYKTNFQFSIFFINISDISCINVVALSLPDNQLHFRRIYLLKSKYFAMKIIEINSQLQKHQSKFVAIISHLKKSDHAGAHKILQFSFFICEYSSC